jgi:hypothetical protein
MMSSRSLPQPSFALLLALGWLLCALQLLLQNWSATGETLLGTDDAMRLVGMRAWLAGQGWFDLHVARVQPPGGFDSHWSRLIDAGLAGVFVVLNWFFDQALAERLMRTLWPMLWLIPTMAGVAAIAWRIAGREAAIVTLLLAVVGLPAFQQFRPGRIDHHNVQIALTMLTVAATVWSPRMKWCAWAAGALTGLGLAIGLELLPFVAACGAALVLRVLFLRQGGEEAGAYGWALAASTLGAFFISVDPEHWLTPACDNISISLVKPLVGLGVSLGVLGKRWHKMPPLLGALIIAGVLFLLLDPHCLRGPYGAMDPAVKPIWLSHVREMQPLLTVMRDMPLTAAGIATFPAAALLCLIALARDGAMRRDFGFLVAAAAFVIAAAITVAMVKGYSYAMWLGMPLVAAAALKLFKALRLKTLVAQFFVALMLTPAALSALTILATDAAASAAGIDASGNFNRPERRICLQSASYAPLARLEPGIVAAEIDYGPFLLALTPHTVLGAPYHRLSSGIIASYRAFASPPDEARKVLAKARADYLVTCGPRGPIGLSDAERRTSLWGRLQAGEVPAWLELIPATRGQAFAVYRVRHER